MTAPAKLNGAGSPVPTPPAPRPSRRPKGPVMKRFEVLEVVAVVDAETAEQAGERLPRGRQFRIVEALSK